VVSLVRRFAFFLTSDGGDMTFNPTFRTVVFDGGESGSLAFCLFPRNPLVSRLRFEEDETCTRKKYLVVDSF